ncbi:hypothetical protein [Streptococcus danieliae]|nr:hypothetical protein [Streptococcus danieliae]MCU0081870.1 hypothetical protein [Streptococcus danieliae]
MTDFERQELDKLRARSWRLDGPDVFTPEEQTRFFELLLKEHEAA